MKAHHTAPTWALFLLAAVAFAFALTGCGTSARDQSIADSAATIWEAAQAQQEGVDVKLTAHSIQCLASSICASLGITYPPAPKSEKKP